MSKLPNWMSERKGSYSSLPLDSRRLSANLSPGMPKRILESPSPNTARRMMESPSPNTARRNMMASPSPDTPRKIFEMSLAKNKKPNNTIQRHYAKVSNKKG